MPFPIVVEHITVATSPNTELVHPDDIHLNCPYPHVTDSPIAITPERPKDYAPNNQLDSTENQRPVRLTRMPEHFKKFEVSFPDQPP